MRDESVIDVDVVVAGGGPAGLATAIHLRRLGLSVCVVDSALPPYDKACGEGLLASGVQELVALGLAADETLGHPIESIRYIDGNMMAEGALGQAGGLGVRRKALMAALWHRALSLGASCIAPERVLSVENLQGSVRAHLTERVLQARYLVAADGLHSRLRRNLHLSGPPTPSSRYGLRRHYRMAPWSAAVEVYWASGCEAYVTPVGPSEVGIAFLTNGRPKSFAVLLSHFPQLVERLKNADFSSALRGAGPLYQNVTKRTCGRVALVGDAAGYVDALTGEGLTLGFACARALASVIAQGRELAPYEKMYSRITYAYRRDAARLLWLMKHPRLRRWALRLLAKAPRLLAWGIARHGALPAPYRVPISSAASKVLAKCGAASE